MPIIDQRPDGCDVKKRKMIRRLYLPFTTPTTAYHSCVCNELVALLNRHLVVSPLNNEDVIKRAFKRFRDIYPPKLLDTWDFTRVLFNKKGCKKKIYKQALDNYTKRGILSKDKEIKMFVKYERMPMRDPLKAPRAIQARGVVFNLYLQQYILPYSKHLTRSMDPSKRFVTKGMDQYQLADFITRCWYSFSLPVAKLLDHDRFDSRTNRFWLKEMHAYIQEHFSDDITDLLCTLESAKCTTFHGIRYRATDCVFSGDVTTSDGNSTINKALLVDYTWGINTIDIDNGDDSVIFLDYHDLDELNSRDLTCYQYKTKHTTVYNLEDIEYCQCHPVKTINGWLMVRDPIRVISRATTCIDPTADLSIWFASVGECEFSCNRGVPVLMSFARMLMKLSVKRMKLDQDFEYHRIRGTFSEEITNEARVSFALAFGIQPTLQLELEYLFDNMVWPKEIYSVSDPTGPLLTIP